MPETDATTVRVQRSTRDRLADLKEYPSMSFDDLLQEMADAYHGESA